VYALHSKLNHACSPNAHVVSGSFVDASIEVVALTDVALGAELCVSYTDPKLTHTQRRRHLLNNHFFVCNCADCVSSVAVA
jgi:SET domain-containing protein